MPHTLAIVGPTASGKSALALAAAQRWPVEIVSVDSALVYRGLDIGSAKPTAAERAAVPHHLIDIREPSQPYSAADFSRDTARLIPEIHARGRHALLVGGTLLYLRALREGLDDMPAADPALRAEIEAEAQRLGWPALHAQLAQVDPVTAARLAPLDKQRIARALEVYRASGQPISAFQRQSAVAKASGPSPTAPEPGHDRRWAQLPVLSLEPQDRAWLHRRIAERLDTMFAQGLVDEVRALRARGDLSPDLPALRSVGYRQVWEALDAGDLRSADELSAACHKALYASRQLAKRQLTGLRAMPDRRVVACDAPDALDRGLQALAEVFDGR